MILDKKQMHPPVHENLCSTSCVHEMSIKKAAVDFYSITACVKVTFMRKTQCFPNKSHPFYEFAIL